MFQIYYMWIPLHEGIASNLILYPKVMTGPCTFATHGRSTANLNLSSCRDNVLKADIFFEELNYEVISEEPSYEASDIFDHRSITDPKAIRSVPPQICLESLSDMCL